MVAVKNVTVNEDYFQGHFPGTPLLPAVLMIETLAQVATMLVVYRQTACRRGACICGVWTTRSSVVRSSRAIDCGWK